MDPNASTSTGPSSGPSGAAGARPSATGTGSPAAGVRPPATKNADGRFIGRRVRKPKLLAVVTASCSGCAGAPVCQIYCPVDACMLWVPAEDAWPYGRIWVDPLKCVGCRKCVGGGPEDTFLEGCPWDAIRLVTTPDWEAAHGPLPY